MSDIRKTIKYERRQGSCCLFNSLQLVYVEQLSQVPCLLFKIIVSSQYIKFNKNDFNEATQENKKKALCLYQLGLCKRMQEKEKQNCKLEEIRAYNRYMKSNNQLLNQQIQKQENEIEVLNKCWQAKKGRPMAKTLQILQQFLNSNQDQESFNQSSIRIIMKTLSSVPELNFELQYSSKMEISGIPVQKEVRQSQINIVESEQPLEKKKEAFQSASSRLINPEQGQENQSKIISKQISSHDRNINRKKDIKKNMDIKMTESFCIEKQGDISPGCQSKVSIISKEPKTQKIQRKPSLHRYETNKHDLFKNKKNAYRVRPNISNHKINNQTYKVDPLLQNTSLSVQRATISRRSSFDIKVIPKKT